MSAQDDEQPIKIHGWNVHRVFRDDLGNIIGIDLIRDGKFIEFR